MEASEKLQKFLDELNAFINHNLELGYITSEMTIEQFKNKFLVSLEDNYIPMLREVEKYRT